MSSRFIGEEQEFLEIFNRVESVVKSGLTPVLDVDIGYNAQTDGSKVIMGLALFRDFTDDEVAFIICHEIVHVRKGHVNFIQGYYEQRQRNLERVIGAKGSLLGAWLGHAIGRLVAILPRERQGEFEADFLAIGMMEACGFDARASVSALRKLNARTVDLGIFSAHPPTQARINVLKRVTFVPNSICVESDGDDD